MLKKASLPNVLYTAILQGRNVLQVFDVTTGIKSYSINLGNVEVINGPIVTNDKVTIVIKYAKGRVEGRVYTLPRGILSYSFTVT